MSASKKPSSSSSSSQQQQQHVSSHSAASGGTNDQLMVALGHARPKTGLAFRMQHQQKQQLHPVPPDGGTSDNNNNNGPIWLVSLQEVCRTVIVANLDRYPPESMGMLDDDEWNLLITLRHSKTKPKSGTGGLDGTGRLAPALSDKYLAAVEKCHPDEKVRESTIADELLWKDCVNYSFRPGSLTRPRILTSPWPLLVERIQTAATTISTILPTTLMQPSTTTTTQSEDHVVVVDNNNVDDQGGGEDAPPPSSSQDTMMMMTSSSASETHGAIQNLEASLCELEQAPMNVNLLVATGAGKTLKKVFKKLQQSRRQQQQQDSYYMQNCAAAAERVDGLVTMWKELAQREGVQVEHTSSKGSSSSQQQQSPAAKKCKTAPSSNPSSCSPSSLSSSMFDPQQQQDQQETDDMDWKLVETCHSWRQLFAALKQREEMRRSKQGQRMRQIRKSLNHERPKVVKVRRAASSTNAAIKHDRILNHHNNKKKNPLKSTFGASIAPMAPTNVKIAQLKRETQVVTGRQNRGDFANAAASARLQRGGGSTPPASMFALAVAGASGAKPGGGGGGKRKVLSSSSSCRSMTAAVAGQAHTSLLTFPKPSAATSKRFGSPHGNNNNSNNRNAALHRPIRPSMGRAAGAAAVGGVRSQSRSPARRTGPAAVAGGGGTA